MTAQARAQEALPLREVGRPAQEQEDEEGQRENGVNNTITIMQRGSTNADYLCARIARDRPDVLARMKVGAFEVHLQACANLG